ncbi:substrate-binding periplasmic protein [Spartinivicinus poritis]|uniref:Transporter substrate-binding domain-containing protein n=1 Tax=Spartinivicinus poritis TaxID=2994640 RepID=A0ABT5UAK6_9GAMM|nr:transporter substrate-binding domain-containing protein [Spartinivicinus sp. A2-2]MDE1463416.1 transporter substrate-binding domain-containing protein [Spartinivicinus sp. A2-2]
MRWKALFIGILTLQLGVLNSVGFAGANTLLVVTEDFPPFQFPTPEGEVSGMATEVVKEVLAKAGIKAEIRLYPWARAYKLALKETNVLIYSIARTRDREHHFKWIGTITPYSVYLWKLASRDDIQLQTLEDAKQFIIGGVTNDVKQDYLVNHGFDVGEQVMLTNSDTLNLKKLTKGRIDLTPFDEVAFAHTARQLGFKMANYKRAFYLEELSSELYMAMSILTPDDLVYNLRRALDKVKDSGRYDEIKQKYLK